MLMRSAIDHALNIPHNIQMDFVDDRKPSTIDFNQSYYLSIGTIYSYGLPTTVSILNTSLEPIDKK